MSSEAEIQNAIKRAAEAVRGASAMLIGAGAGMGVDSGLPDFRGNEGFWKAYPPFRGKQFAEMSTPHWFRTDPALAWGFFGHRLNLYRGANPHRGFHILLKWIERFSLDAFVLTSNVDGQFQKAGFIPETIFECHGSIHHLQCLKGCQRDIWSASDVTVDVDRETIRARGELPQCPRCGALARPNILMFNDYGWDSARSSLQEERFNDWRGRQSRFVTIELGAGLAIPTVRLYCEDIGNPLIRINPREAEVSDGAIGIELGAQAALERMDAVLT